MGSLATRVRGIATAAFRHASLRKAAFELAAARGRSLVLVYHRLAPGGAESYEVVPSLSSAVFHRQLEILGEVGDIVTVGDLMSAPEPGRRIRFAITFDDDYPSHYQYALPLLQQYGVQATFFLSGRSSAGLGPYWWMLLERMIAERGVDETRRMLGVSGTTPAEVAAACEHPVVSERIPALVPSRESAVLEADAIRALAD